MELYSLRTLLEMHCSPETGTGEGKKIALTCGKTGKCVSSNIASGGKASQ